MAHNDNDNALHDASAHTHIVFASGGSRAILGGVGAVFAFHLLGMRQWRTVGGVSGGSIPALLLAAGFSSTEILHIAIETEFQGKLIPRTGALRRLFALAFKYRYEMTLPKRGVFGTKPLEEFIDAQVTAWPENFWTIASSGPLHVLFNAQGAHKFVPGSGVTETLEDKPVKLGMAICASCAVPGVVDAVPYKGHYLHDGAIRDNGQCPVDVARIHYRAHPENTIAFDVGEDDIKNSWLVRLIWRLSCLGRCGEIYGKHPDGSDGTIVVTPGASGFHALKFHLSPDEKWRSVIAGYLATVETVANKMVVDETALARARTLAHNLSRALAESTKTGRLSAAAETLLRSEGLY